MEVRAELSLAPLPHPTLARENVLDVLRLIRSENVGPVTFFQLLTRYGSARAALDAVPELAARGGKRQIALYDKARSEQELEAVAAFGAEIVLYGQPRYPELLLQITDAPPLLTIKGHSHLWSRKSGVALVGARNASANGCQFAYRLAKELGERELLVVSGLARGIDASAHKGALESGTVAVIASGIDHVYPPENKELYEKIAEAGAIVSEQPFGAGPRSQSFPARNRIISGMSLGVVVVEASFKSGSLITARMAGEQGRDVFAVPGSPLDARCRGSNDLIRQGAVLTESAGDILRNISSGFTGVAEQEAPFYPHMVPRMPSESELDRARDSITQKLGYDPVSVDELAGQCQVTANLALTVLLELELAGKLLRHPVNRVSLRFEDPL